MAEDGPHIALSRLREYSGHQLLEYAKNLDSSKIPVEERDHLMACQDCVAILWLCRGAASVDDVQLKLKERGINTD